MEVIKATRKVRTVGDIWDEVYDAYANRGVRLYRLGVTDCRHWVYDYDEKAYYAWISWTGRGA